jgi:hypothetical protein
MIDFITMFIRMNHQTKIKIYLTNCHELRSECKRFPRSAHFLYAKRNLLVDFVVSKMVYSKFEPSDFSSTNFEAVQKDKFTLNLPKLFRN